MRFSQISRHLTPIIFISILYSCRSLSPCLFPQPDESYHRICHGWSAATCESRTWTSYGSLWGLTFSHPCLRRTLFNKYKAASPSWHFKSETTLALFKALKWQVIRMVTNLSGRKSRKPFRIFKDMKSSKMVSPIAWVSLELSCSSVPQTRSIATFTSSAAWRTKGLKSFEEAISKPATKIHHTFFEKPTCFSNCLYEMLKKSTLTALRGPKDKRSQTP